MATIYMCLMQLENTEMYSKLLYFYIKGSEQINNCLMMIVCVEI